MKIATLVLLLFVVACAPVSTDVPSELPADVQAAVDADTAATNANTAQMAANRARATALYASRFATAARQATIEILGMEGTRIAGQIALAHVTETAVIRQGETAYAVAQVSKTETAAAAASVAAQAAVHKTEASIQNSTIIANNAIAKTEQAQRTITRQSQVDATATYVAAAPTRIAVARIQANEEERRAQAEAEAKASAEMSIQLAPLKAAWDMFWLPVAVSLLVLGMIWGLIQLLLAAAHFLNARALAHESPAVRSMVVVENGRVVGYITNGQWRMNMFPQSDPPQEVKELPPPAQAEPPPEVAKPNPLVLNGVHWQSLLTFTRAILDSGDWTQATWADKSLPMGFVLTKDSHDADGNPVKGGYALMLEQFTNKNLIIGRGPGSAGRWNPHAPREVDGVMAVLFGRIPMPPLVEAPTKTTATKRKQTGKPILTAN